MSSIGDKIKRRRIEMNMSQDELAKKLGYSSRSTINKIEKGINDITQSKIVAFADALDTSIAYLMGWEEELKEDIEKDPITTATECASMIKDLEFRKLYKEYNYLSVEKKKQVFDFVLFLKEH